jgi:endoglucanase
VNLGNALEAPSEGEWGVFLQAQYFRLIREAGFDLVRIPIRWSAHAEAQSPYAIEEAFFTRVDWAVEQALEQGLTTIINIHHYDELVRQPAAHRERFVALWRQLAARYRDYPDTLWFELLNEPHDRLGGATWNTYAERAIAVIRETNPTRTIVVGPGDWNSVSALSALKLPEDDRQLVVTFHYYAPFQFTHQGAEWVQGSNPWLGATWQGSEAERRAVQRDLDEAARWAQANKRRLLLGEFGAYSKADMASRARWTAFVAREAEVRGIDWAYWEFCAGFGVYDAAAGTWREPLREALLPAP